MSDANRVKVVKWFLIGFVCLASATVARGDAVADYTTGRDAFDNQRYDEATKALDDIIKNYPTFQSIDDVTLLDGQAYLYNGKYSDAISVLAKILGNKNKAAYRAQALYFTALAQFYQGQKTLDKKSLNDAATTLSELIDLINKSTNADDKALLENSLYYRALAFYLREDYPKAEPDLKQLTTAADFAKSLVLPDYFLRLGTIYQLEANQAIIDKKPDDQVKAFGKQAIEAFDHVVNDPNALVQANDANMSEASVYFMLAQMESGNTGYQKSLETFRRVHRKDDMIPLQEARLKQLQQRAAEIARINASAPNGHSTASSEISLLISRERGRLDDLKNGTDPIIQALIGMAQCYVAMKQPDEARTILHRLSNVKLTPEQQQTVDFQTLYSYVLGHQVEKADKAYTDYISKHASDPNADSIRVQIADALATRKDWNGALDQAQKSQKEFPNGKNVGAAVALQAQMLGNLKRQDEADKLIDSFLKANPNNPAATQMALTKAQGLAARGDLPGAATAYKQLRDNPSANAELQSAAGIYYVQTLYQIASKQLGNPKLMDDVITEAKAFETKYPQAKGLPSIMLFGALALNAKKDPGAVAALQDIAKKFPKEDAAPFALQSVVQIYKAQGNAAGMMDAAKALREAYPESYALILAANGDVSEALIAQKTNPNRFESAIALYQPLTDAPKTDIAAQAGNKIGSIWLAAAESLGHYQSMSVPLREEGKKRIANSEQAYLTVLKKFPSESNAVGDAFDGIVSLAKLQRSWGLLKDADLEGYITKLCGDLTSPDIAPHAELAKASLVFIAKEGAKQYPAALDRMRKVVAANPAMTLSRLETARYVDLLLYAKDYATAAKIAQDLLDNSKKTDATYTSEVGDAYYGLGAAALGQNDFGKAKENFTALTGLEKGGVWHPHYLDVKYGLAYIDEQSGQQDDLNSARQIYAQLMQAGSQGGAPLAAKAMLGYGRILEKSGFALKPSNAGPNEYAVHYYQEPSLIYGHATPEQSAEGLFNAGQVYDHAGDKTNAKKQYDDLLKTYSTLAPDWAEKAKKAESGL